jgi:hypothetical protein
MKKNLLKNKKGTQAFGRVPFCDLKLVAIMKWIPLYFGNVHCLQALRTRLDFKLHFVAIVQGLIPVANDRLVMDEDIFAICARNESKAFSSVKPLDCSFFHGTNPFLKSYPDQPSGRRTPQVPALAKNINEQ